MQNKYDICFLGDIYLSEDLNRIDEDLLDLLKSCSHVIANLEGPICDVEVGLKSNKYAAIKINPDYIKYLTVFNISVVSLGNNHAMDFGYPCLKETFNYLSKNNIKWFGAGKDIESAFSPYIFTLYNNIKVGIIGISTVFVPDAAASIDRPGIAGVRVKTNFVIDPKISIEEPAAPYMIDGEVLEEDFKLLKNILDGTTNATNLTVVFTHWGVGISPYHKYMYGGLILEYQRKLAYRLLENKVDLIIGTHPHSIAPVEKYNEKFIFYSLGNFVFHPIVDGMSDIGCIVCYNYDPKIIDLYFVHVNNSKLILVKDLDKYFEIINFIHSSNKLGVEFEKIEKGLRIKI